MKSSARCLYGVSSSIISASPLNEKDFSIYFAGAGFGDGKPEVRFKPAKEIAAIAPKFTAGNKKK